MIGFRGIAAAAASVMLLVAVAAADARVVQVATLRASSNQATGGFVGLAEANGVLVSDDGGATDVFVAPSAGWRGGPPVAVLSQQLYAPTLSTSGSAVIGVPPGSLQELVFDRPAGGWSGTISPSGSLATSTGAVLEGAVISGRTIAAVGSDNAVYVYRESAGGWSGVMTETARLTDSSGDRLLPPQIAERSVFAVSASHKIDVFARPPDGWGGVVHESSAITNPLFLFSIARRYAIGGDRLGLVPTAGVPVFTEARNGWNGALRPIAHLYASSPAGPLATAALSREVAAISTFPDIGPENACPCVTSVSVFTKPPGGWSGTLVSRPAIHARAPGGGVFVLDRRTLFTASGDGIGVFAVSGREGRRVRPPVATRSSEAGIAQGRPVFKFTLRPASGDPALEWLKLRLPRGLSLDRSEARVQRAVTTSQPAFSYTSISNTDGALLVRPKLPVKRITVTIRPGALHESQMLAGHRHEISLVGQVQTRDTVGDLKLTTIRFRLSARAFTPQAA